jgi:hypothetical protein
MKRITFYISLAVFTVITTFSVAGQKTDFSGTWKLDRTKSTLLENLPTLARIRIEIKGDSLLTERVYEGGDGQEYPFIENLTLDSKEHIITIYEMPRKSKASWSEQDGSVNLESITTFGGDSGPEDFISKETWKVNNGNKILVISYKNKLSLGESEGTFFFNKAE